MQIEITGLKETADKLNDIAKRQIPYALKNALNKTAFEVRAAVRQEMARAFDRPTAYTLKSVVVGQATKENLVAAVALVDPAEFVGDIGTGKFVVRKDQTGGPAPKHLLPQMYGGNRAMKPFEKRLQKLGILRSDQSVVPARGAWLDSHGNIPYGELVKILSEVQAFGGVAGYGMNRKGKSKGYYRNFRYFVLRRGGVPVGIAAREARSNSVQPVLAFVSKATYRKRFDFYRTAESAVYATLNRNFKAALRQAVATAK